MYAAATQSVLNRTATTIRKADNKQVFRENLSKKNEKKHQKTKKNLKKFPEYG
jgi:hypothetical protein